MTLFFAELKKTHVLRRKTQARHTMEYTATREFARQQDAADPLRHYREQFHIPQHKGKDSIYFCGNSLGLQPRALQKALDADLKKWAAQGVEGHFSDPNPWTKAHSRLTDMLAGVVGAKPIEVVAMNSLTVNLHLLLVSFYRPTATRFKILMEGGAFPSDQYALASQTTYHGFPPEEAIVELFPRAGEETLRTEDILQKIEELGDSLALVLFGGINYYTGQFFDLKAITEKAHSVKAKAGFDLAHAVGNVPLQLHNWNVDFATWCSYKYMNGSPGGMSGIFIHERFADLPVPRFTGWWGHDESARFQMDKTFVPMRGAEGWQLSCAPSFLMVAHEVSLRPFAEIGMQKLREKSLKLTGYLEFLIHRFNQEQENVRIKIITPEAPEERGCQLSLVLEGEGKALFNFLMENGFIGDWREPDVIRVAPVPLYNSFEDVFRFYQLLGQYEQQQVLSSANN